MKNKNLLMVVRASLKARKVSSFMFCFFVIISFTLVFTASGIISPMWHNINENINNHILRRELVVEFPESLSDGEVRKGLDAVKATDGVTDVYRMPTVLSASDQSGVLHSMYDLSWVHKHFTLQITDGRAFDESEQGVALVPESFEDYNEDDGTVNNIDGAGLIGKTLEFKDGTDCVHRLNVVGSYDATDPIFTGKEILIPREELLKFNEQMLQKADEYPVFISGDKSYIAVVENPQISEAVLAELEKITTAYSHTLNVDSESYNTAFFIILGVTVLFVLLTIFGFYMFLKGSVSVRTKELALCRAIGYKPKNLFFIIFSEYLFLGTVSLVIGAVISCLLINFAVNPYLDGAFGQTFMKMSVEINPLAMAAIALCYILLILLVCITAVKRTSRIDLTVLLKA